jgi:hypothetical protein
VTAESPNDADVIELAALVAQASDIAAKQQTQPSKNQGRRGITLGGLFSFKAERSQLADQ